MDSLSVNELLNIEAFPYKQLFEGVDYPWEALSKLKQFFNEIPLGEKLSPIPSNVYLENSDSITIGKEVIIEPGAYIKGPCIIGNYSTIRHGAYIRENVLIGMHCVIGHCSEVKGSIFLNHAKAPHFNYIGDSILGEHVNLGAGVKCGNVRLDKKEVFLSFNGKRINTHLTKFGVILGDGASIGCNTSFNPGTIVGKHTIVYPCLSVAGVIARDTKVKTSNL